MVMLAAEHSAVLLDLSLWVQHALQELCISHLALQRPAFAQQPCCKPLVKQRALLQKAAEAKAYMQYVAFESATHRYVPVLLTDGNTMILYVHNTKISAHQRMYWGFHQILDASIYLGELVKQIALSNPLTRSYIPGQDDQPASPEDPGTERGGPSTDHAELSRDLDEGEHDVKGTPMTNAKKHRDTSRPARSMPLGQRLCLTEMQDADMQEALRLARFHPCVKAVYGLPPYAKPNFYELAS